MMLSKPRNDEIPAYYVYMLSQIENDENILGQLEDQSSEVDSFFRSLSNEKLSYSYAENKWTPKQILNHFTDMERVFAYRALCFSRNDQQALPGAEEDDYAAEIQADDFSIDQLLEDFTAVRKSSLTLYNMIRDDVWLYNGNANGVYFPLRAFPYITFGHTQHHIRIIKERYL